MKTLAEEDIGRRALLDILLPVVQAPARANGKVRRKKQRVREEREPVADAEPRPMRISVVERLSTETVSVCWSDARMGRYSEQTWRLGRARTDSYCLLTGRHIHYGDKVFRPQTVRGYITPDHNRMILACAVDDLSGLNA